MVRGGWVARPSPRCCPGKAVARGAMAGGGSIRAAALPGTLLPRTPPAEGASVTAARGSAPAAMGALVRPRESVQAGPPARSRTCCPSPRGGRGRETEPGMTQGLPERPPLGHAMHALRHFVRDAVVFDDYTIAEGMVVPQGALRRRYHPETCPTLPQQLARLTRGDTHRRAGLCPDLWLVRVCSAGRGCRPWRAE